MELAAARDPGSTASQNGGTRMVPGVVPSCHTRKDGGRIPNAFSAALTVKAFFISFVDGTSITLGCYSYLRTFLYTGSDCSLHDRSVHCTELYGVYEYY